MKLYQIKKWLRSRLYISKLPLERREDLLSYNQTVVWLKIKFRCGENFTISQGGIASELNAEGLIETNELEWSGDKVREVIRELRSMGFPILSSSKTVVGGYFTPATREELDKYIKVSYKRARSIMWPLKMVKKGGIDWLYLISQKTLPFKQGDFD